MTASNRRWKSEEQRQLGRDEADQFDKTLYRIEVLTFDDPDHLEYHYWQENYRGGMRKLGRFIKALEQNEYLVQAATIKDMGDFTCQRVCDSTKDIRRVLRADYEVETLVDDQISLYRMAWKELCSFIDEYRNSVSPEYIVSVKPIL